MSGWAQGAVWAAGAILTLDALLRLFGGLWRRTGGRWRHARAQLARLAANADIGYFDEVLGAPFLKRQHVLLAGSPRLAVDQHSVAGVREYIYVGLGFYVQAVTEGNDRVIAYTVTMRNARLKAKVPVPNLGIFTSDGEPVELELGSSRFADVPWTAGDVYADVGAHNFAYRESYYLANPGNYQSLVLSWNDAGVGRFVSDLDIVTRLARDLDDNRARLRSTSSRETTEDYAPEIIEAFLGSEAGKAIRAELEINSYTLTAPHVQVDPSLPIYGVDVNDVRVLDRPSRKAIREFRHERKRALALAKKSQTSPPG